MATKNTILMAALGGAIVGALLASFLTTEKGKELLETASTTIKDLAEKGTAYAKSNFGDVLHQTTNSMKGIAKEKASQNLS